MALWVAVESVLGADVLLHWKVTDTGIGIPGDKLEMVLKPFMQADGSNTRTYGGTGLGLAISKHLVEMMGGRVWAESSVGEGTTLHFTVRLGASAVEEGPTTGLRDFAGRRALLVEANATSRGILEETLESWGFEVEAHEGVEEALADLKQATAEGDAYAIAVVDIGLLDNAGRDAVCAFKDAPGTGVIALSCWHQRGGCREHPNASSELVKPVKSADLHEAIRAALGTPQRDRLQEYAGPALRVLVVDDNSLGRKLAERLLEKRGHIVKAVGDGAAALDAFAADSFDVVLMDIEMPGQDGLSLARELRGREQGQRARVPIIALTAHVGDDMHDRCLQAGMDGLLPKPLRPEHLFAALARIHRAIAA